jgi:hypothetical protein
VRTAEDDPPGFDEAVWRADAAERARRFVAAWEPDVVYCPENALTNRDDVGDETFHDVVDFMFELQPEWPHCVRREDLVGVAENIVKAEGLCDVPLQRYLLEREDFDDLVAMLLMIYESPEDGEALPEDFPERKAKLVWEFFGEKASINFKKFHEVFESGKTEFVSSSLCMAGGVSGCANVGQPTLLEMLDYIFDQIFQR